jgi:hypothetical protein
MQQRLKPQAGTARTQVVAPQLFVKLDIAVHDPVSPLDAVFEGKDLRRLLETSKARLVTEAARLLRGHDTSPFIAKERRPYPSSKALAIVSGISAT